MKKALQKINLSKYSATILAGATLLLTINTHAQIITTVAGNGTGAFNSDGIQATAAEVNNASGVAIDKNGNVYIADNLNNRIRKIDASTGIISTMAGNGTPGYNSDGIQATAAELYQPWNVSLDTAGNIYIADWANHRIRKVTAATGIITTIAGTGTPGYNGDGIQATAAQLFNPDDAIADNAGNVYIVDVNNQRIREINAAGVISTIAGTGTGGYNGDGIQATAAELHNPQTVALDNSGNVYIADRFNNEIRKITVSTGIISSVAGNGTGNFSGDGGQATAAEIYYPTGVKLDAFENIYIADDFNNRIRKVKSSTGIITTVAGNGTAGYNGDGIMATTAELNEPWDIALGNGAFYIADFKGNRVRKVPISTAGIEDVSNGINVNVYPNPVNQNINVQLDGENGKMNFTIFNTLGQEVLQQYSSQNTTSISVANLSTGIYFLKIQNQDGNVVTRKISVIR